MYKFKLKLLEDPGEEVSFCEILEGITEEEVDQIEVEVNKMLRKLYDDSIADGFVNYTTLIRRLHDLYTPGTKQWEYLMLFAITTHLSEVLEKINESVIEGWGPFKQGNIGEA